MEIIIAVFVLLVLALIIIYNKLVKAKKIALQSKSSIDVYLKQRFDLIPNLVECVKGYMNYESEVLEKIAVLRNEYEKQKEFKIAKKLNEEYEKILLLIENYPQIKAGEQFIDLQNSMVKLESQIQAARRLYNGDVTRYNIMIHSIPINIIAMIFGFKEMELFEININEKNNIKMEF